MYYLQIISDRKERHIFENRACGRFRRGGVGLRACPPPNALLVSLNTSEQSDIGVWNDNICIFIYE